MDITHVSISWLSLGLGDTFAVQNIYTHLLFCLFSLEWLPYTASIYILGEDNSKGYDLDNFYWVEWGHLGNLYWFQFLSFLGLWYECTSLLLLEFQPWKRNKCDVYHFQEEALRARTCMVYHISFPCHLGGARSTCWGGVSFNLCLCLTLGCKFPVSHFFTQHAGWANNAFSWHSPTEYWGCLWLQKNLT